MQVFAFPMKAPEGALVREDLDTVSHLQLCLDYQRHWCEHRPSVTISVKEDEWDSLGNWIYQHFDELAGASCLPYDTGSYEQSPYVEITRERYEVLAAGMPQPLGWRRFKRWRGGRGISW
jgi:ribonucleoside-diphosphate reductase alpha chain